MLTVSSSLDDKNPDFFFFQAYIKDRQNEIFMMGEWTR